MNMKSILSAACAIGAVWAAPAMAEDGPAFTGNIALTTDYAFRGISQTDGSPAVQGGFDASYGSLYAGAWASNVDFGEFGVSGGLELDLYGGVKFDLEPIDLDFGLLAYLYPSSSDIPGPTATSEGELDYYEIYGKAAFAPTDALSFGAALYYSPDFTGETGDGLYGEVSGSVVASEAVSFSGALGYQSIDDVSGVFPGAFSDEYLTWNVGATVSVSGFALDLRYVDTDIETNDPILTQAFTTEDRVDGRVIFTIKRAL
jgi:uncharacterized protein (TIGR02001 family)